MRRSNIRIHSPRIHLRRLSKICQDSGGVFVGGREEPGDVVFHKHFIAVCGIEAEEVYAVRVVEGGVGEGGGDGLEREGEGVIVEFGKLGAAGAVEVAVECVGVEIETLRAWEVGESSCADEVAHSGDGEDAVGVEEVEVAAGFGAGDERGDGIEFFEDFSGAGRGVVEVEDDKYFDEALDGGGVGDDDGGFGVVVVGYEVVRGLEEGFLLVHGVDFDATPDVSDGVGVHDEFGYNGELIAASFECVEEVAVLVSVGTCQLSCSGDDLIFDHVVRCHALSHHHQIMSAQCPLLVQTSCSTGHSHIRC